MTNPTPQGVTLREEVRRIMPILERLEDSPLWADLTAGTGIATLNGLRAALPNPPAPEQDSGELCVGCQQPAYCKKNGCATPTAEPAVEAVAVPQGWKLVPLEPTEEMIEAGKDVKRRRLLASVKAIQAGEDPDELSGKTAGAEYRAMLAASPEFIES